jgi:hypothetical protein
VARQNLCVLPASCLCAELPKLDLAVAATGDESACGAGLVSTCTDNLARCNSRCPRNTVYARAASLEDLVRPVIVLELENRNVAVRGSASEEAAGLVGSPSDVVDRSGVERNIVDLLPGAALFAPNEDLAVVGGRCENVAIFGMRPGYTPYSTLMSVKLSTTCYVCVLE